MANSKMSAFAPLLISQINPDTELIALSGVTEVGKPIGENVRLNLDDFVAYIAEEISQGASMIFIVDNLPPAPTLNDEGVYIVKNNDGTISLFIIQNGVIWGTADSAPVVNIWQGTNNPNGTPPPVFKVGDFYYQDNPPLQIMYQYNGTIWAEVGIGQGGGGIIFNNYLTIPALLADQVSQIDQEIYFVKNASADPNLDFDPSETKLHAYYRYNGVATNDIDDYTLISAPFAFSQGGSDLEIYSESGTLAGGDGVAIIGDYDPVAIAGSGIYYRQFSNTVTGIGDIFNFIAQNTIGIVSRGYLTIDGENVLIIARQSVIDFYNASNKALKFDFSNITVNRTLTFQDKSGVAALLSDLVDTKYTAGNGAVLTGTVFTVPVNPANSGTFIASLTATASGLRAVMGTPPDTKYTAGSGMSLSGTEFSLPVTITGTGTFVKSVTQTAIGIDVVLGTPPSGGATIEFEIKEVPANTYLLLEEDFDKQLYFTHIDGCVITVPTGLPKNSYRGKQMTDGQLEFISASGVTIGYVDEEFTNKTAGKNSVWALDWDATDEYTLYGVLELVDGGSELEIYSETVVTAGGAMPSQPTPTTFLKFTNQTTPVILGGFGDPVDGKEITIWNQTLQAMDILHESPSATANERISVLGEQDVLLPVDGKSVFRYSAESSRWTMVGIFGAGYEPTLIGAGERAVTVNAEGVYQEEELMEAKAWNINITTNQSESDLNTAYPNALQGFVLVCPENGREYEMYDESQSPKKWLWRTITKVV